MPPGFHLEDADGLASPHHNEGIIEHRPLLVAFDVIVAIRDGVDAVMDVAMSRDQFAGFAHNGQGGQAEEIHLEQADRFSSLHGKLGHCAQRTAGRVFAGDAVQGHQINKRAIGDDYTGGMGRGVAGHALQFDGGVNHTLQIGIGFIQSEQFRVAVDVFANFLLAGILRDQGGGAVDHTQIDIEGAPDITDGGFGAHCAECYDRRYLVLAVFLRGVGNHLAAAVVGIIEVDIRHADAPRIEEAFEQQAVSYWVDIGDAKTVGDKAGCARPSDIPPNIGLAGEFAEGPKRSGSRCRNPCCG